jgi:uncharacterized protein YcfL
MKLTALGLASLLLLTGCSSYPSLTLEDQTKLIEYEKCLLFQQDNLNTINERLFKTDSEIALLELLSNQSQAIDDTNLVPRFEIHLKNCNKYRP